MLYPFMTLPDETEIVHSESIIEDGVERVKVCIEKPIDYGFKSATCWLPDYRWETVEGFTDNELADLRTFIESNSQAIFDRAK